MTLAHRPVQGQTAPRAVDFAIAAFALGASLALLRHGGVPAIRSGSELDSLTATLAACATLPLIAWRRAPLVVFLATAAANVLAAGAGTSIGVPLGPTAALYLLAAGRDALHPWTKQTTAITVALFVAYAAATTVAVGAVAGGWLLHVGLAWAVAWFAGERTRLRHEHIAELETRAVRAERESQHERDLAATEERARIARDLHDSAGHAINVIAVRAGAARLRHDEDPERSRRALAEIEDVARDTAAEIDTIVGALRDNEAGNGAVEAPPGLASLATLVAHHTSVGLDLTVATTGVERQLRSAVDVAAYRILQEALTNAARHGSGSAEVEVNFRDDGLGLAVTNPAGAAGSATGSAGGGHGLVGMRERATLLHGTFDSRRVNGTFRVLADLPYAPRRP